VCWSWFCKYAFIFWKLSFRRFVSSILFVFQTRDMIFPEKFIIVWLVLLILSKFVPCFWKQIDNFHGVLPAVKVYKGLVIIIQSSIKSGKAIKIKVKPLTSRVLGCSKKRSGKYHRTVLIRAAPVDYLNSWRQDLSTSVKRGSTVSEDNPKVEACPFNG